MRHLMGQQGQEMPRQQGINKKRRRKQMPGQALKKTWLLLPYFQ
jgi:hypothetical protein